ncbi:MAG: diacylglycerol kinase [Treponema sp.]|jgi:diacylglycerol kinase family enzyme|nr:diacylglycerol kinase [Treponema sp.]
MKFEEFGALLREICSHTPLASGQSLLWTVIANPNAGGFTISARWKKHRAILKAYAEKAADNFPKRKAGPSRTAGEGPGRELGQMGLILTEAPGHAGKIAGALIEEILSFPDHSAGDVPFHLIIIAGGDGTSLEVLTALYHAPARVRSHTAILRLPMGTGNDGADAWELDKALDLLIHPVAVDYARGLRLTTAAGRGPFLAFNILSVGLDAFVTHMTNKMKGKFPGDSYKLWVDIASLLYDRLYKVGPMEVRAFDNSLREFRSFQERILLLAVGATGRRTYGSRKHILPDDRNVCAVRQMPLLRKVALKGLFTTGEHIDKPESQLFNARRVEFRGEEPILAQMDGETVLLQREDYPAAIELTEPAIPVLKRI